MQENWETQLDGGDQFSHCALAPLIVLYQSIAGIHPTAPGFAQVEIRPQLGGIGDLDLVAHTPRGPIRFVSHGGEFDVRVPAGCDATIIR